MSSEEERFRRADDLLECCLDLPPNQRPALLDRECAGEPELRRLVERLLGSAEEPDGSFLAPAGALDALDWPLDEGGDLEPGQRVGRYRIRREIGRGGMAVVYLAERADGEYHQRVALKVVKRGIDTDEVVRRFQQERQILALLEHPAIARLLDGGSLEDGRPYFVLEHVEGEPIDAYCDRLRLGLRARLRLFARAARAVEHAHRNLVVHRDLKPSNLLVTAAGDPKLLDFGIAKVLDPQGLEAGLTRTRGRLMTPAFASPEQVRGESLTTASDVYQLGLMLYRLLAGQWPYRLRSSTPGEVAKAICQAEPSRPSSVVTRSPSHPPQSPSSAAAEAGEATADQVAAARRRTPQRLRRELRGDLDTLVLTALAKEPERRFGSVSRLIDDIERYLDGRPIAARPASAWYRASKLVRRHRLAALALVIALLTASLYAFGLARERDRARRSAAEATKVADFLSGLFESAAPHRAGGEQVSAREIVDRGAHWLLTELDEQPSLRAELMTRVGRVYGDLAHYREAAELLERAVEQRRRGGDDSALADSLAALAAVRQAANQLPKAAELYEEALVLRRREDRDPPRLAELLAGLGSVRAAQGRFDDALGLLGDALDLQLSQPTVDRGALGLIRQRLAMVHWQRQDPAVAGPLLDQAIADLGAAYPPDHPRKILARAARAEVLGRMGERQEALVEYTALLPPLEQIYGSDHPELAEHLASYGDLLRRDGQAGQALELQHRARRIRLEALGSDHPLVARSDVDIGLSLLSQGDLERAKTWFERAADLGERVLEPDHPQLSVALRNLAEVEARLGNLQRAVVLQERILEIRQQVYEPEHSSFLEPLVKLGRLRLELGQPDAAEDPLRRALELGWQLDPSGTHGRTMPQIALARCLAMLGRYDEAEALLVELAPLLEGSLHIEIERRLLVAWQVLEEARGRPAEAQRWQRRLAERVRESVE